MPEAPAPCPITIKGNRSSPAQRTSALDKRAGVIWSGATAWPKTISNKGTGRRELKKKKEFMQTVPVRNGAQRQVRHAYSVRIPDTNAPIAMVTKISGSNSNNPHFAQIWKIAAMASNASS